MPSPPPAPCHPSTSALNSKAPADPGTAEPIDPRHRPDVIQLEAFNKKCPDQPTVKRRREEEYLDVCQIFQLPRCRVLTAAEKMFPEAVCPDTSKDSALQTRDCEA